MKPYLARRFPSFDFNNPVAGEPRYDAGYDCELPADERTELVARERPRILGRKTPATLEPPIIWSLDLALLIAVMIVGV